jgi:hypothetical protein
MTCHAKRLLLDADGCSDTFLMAWTGRAAEARAGHRELGAMSGIEVAGDDESIIRTRASAIDVTTCHVFDREICHVPIYVKDCLT